MRYSTFGRPRRITDNDIVEILAWADRQETRRQLAVRIGVSVETVSKVIRSRSMHYKSESPELRALFRSARRKMRSAGGACPLHW
jgi:transcriptional regulator with XRE-family HTH domain